MILNFKKSGLGVLLTLLAVLAVGALSQTPAFAQAIPGAAADPNQAASAPTPCAVVAQDPAQQPPNFGGYPTEYPQDGSGYQSQPPDPPKPQNPVRKVCEDGKIEIRLGNDRHFGYRIGDHIPIVVLIATDPTVRLDFTSLAQQVLGFDGSDFELAAPPVVRSQVLANGKVLYRIDLTVLTWVPKDQIVFNLDLRYATDLAPDKKTPNWKRLTTPDFVVSRSPTADNGENLLEGDLDSKVLGTPWSMYPALALAVLLIGLWPGLALVKWINRVRPRKVLPPKAAAWKVLDPAIKQALASGFTLDTYRQIASALRRYLGATRGTPIEPATFQEVKGRLENDADLQSIERSFVLCERVIFEGESLSDEENGELIALVEKLVPRPWESR